MKTTGMTFAEMREVALGRLLYEPSRFGAMLAGDFLDAIAGYFKGETNNMRGIAELIRTQTAILWNIQVARESKLSPPQLWPLPWDNGQLSEGNITQGEADGIIPGEEKQNLQQLQDEFLLKHYPDK
jgi:hypothetical protein